VDVSKPYHPESAASWPYYLSHGPVVWISMVRIWNWVQIQGFMAVDKKFPIGRRKSNHLILLKVSLFSRKSLSTYLWSILQEERLLSMLVPHYAQPVQLLSSPCLTNKDVSAYEVCEVFLNFGDGSVDWFIGSTNHHRDVAVALVIV
jgi:hypothetical protein